MKTSAKMSARLRTSAFSNAVAERIVRSCLRAWLRYRLDNCTRSLHCIAAQRENDFHAERMLHRQISAMRSRLQSL